MSGAEPEGDDGQWSLEQLECVVAQCDRFEAAWRSGRRPRIEEYLAEVTEPVRPALRGELLALEQELRQGCGERPDTGKSLDPLPNSGTLVEAGFTGKRGAREVEMAGKRADSTGFGRFDSTDWQLISAARGADVPEARKALAELCAVYWYPLYAYLRRRGHSAHQAQDLTQGLFAILLERDFLAGLAPEKGKFRSFLLSALQNHVVNERERAGARKRGGGCAVFSIDLPDAEGRYAAEPSHDLSPERLFERRWAVTLLDRVLRELGAEMAQANKRPLFDRLGPALLAGGEAAPYAQIAAELGMTEGAVKAAAHRLRRRFGVLIRAEVARTVRSSEEIEDEIRALFAALS
jgi:RNA polymerase sigma-70 factor (ECF subfamily)